LVGKNDIEFIEADAPITDPITKFSSTVTFGDAGIGYAYIS
jgi:hypothetical protein